MPIAPNVSDVSNAPIICRPHKLTCRWVNEMSTSINILCPSVSPIETVRCKTDNNPDVLWEKFISENNTSFSKCENSDTVRKILEYEMDYNDVLKLSRRDKEE